MVPILPQWRRGGNIHKKNAEKIGRKVMVLSVMFGLGFICMFLGYEDKFRNVFASMVSKDEDLSTELPAVLEGQRPSNDIARRLVSKSDCTAPASSPCGGACLNSEEKSIADKLGGSFIMVDATNLENIDRPRLKAEAMGWFVWYLFNIFYMFCALAIVCDEFFVPALESFVDEFGISMDVAGATFMAAGGSMPELATALIATFQESVVGFAAIVGSAVFNVLFVIAVCAISSKDVLVLTWWPLARDCTFYLVALMSVVLVFKGTSPKEIHTGEAVFLFCEYLLYCTFMKFNGRIAAFFEEKLGKRIGLSAVAPEEGQPPGGLERQESGGDRNFSKPGTFRVGIVQLLTQQAYLHETAGVAAVTQIAGDLDATFKKLDKDGNGMLSIDEIKELLHMLHLKPDSTVIKAALKRITRTGADHISYEAFKKWYLASEARIEAEVQHVFDRFDKDKNGFLQGHEIKAVLKSLGHKPSDDEVIAFLNEILEICKETEEESPPMQDGDGPPVPPKIATSDQPANSQLEPLSSGKLPSNNLVSFCDATNIPEVFAQLKINLDQFEKWYQHSMFYQKKVKQKEIEEKAEQGGLSLEAPGRPQKTGDEAQDRKNHRLWISAMIWFWLTYPLVCVMYCTLPDVRTPKWQRNWKMAAIAFSLSLIWIGIFSNWLYECLVVCSNTLDIPPAVSAVTLLAGGTSIPDLLSSYIVARNGEGDMAVSSSIGSNIFDVTVGLPVPWFLYTVIKGKPVMVQSDSLEFSIMVLIVMIGLVIASIMAMKWRMTKSLGYVMLVLYVVFVTQNLLMQLPEGNPILATPFT